MVVLCLMELRGSKYYRGQEDNELHKLITFLSVNLSSIYMYNLCGLSDCPIKNPIILV